MGGPTTLVWEVGLLRRPMTTTTCTPEQTWSGGSGGGCRLQLWQRQRAVAALAVTNGSCPLGCCTAAAKRYSCSNRRESAKFGNRDSCGGAAFKWSKRDADYCCNFCVSCFIL